MTYRCPPYFRPGILDKFLVISSNFELTTFQSFTNTVSIDSENSPMQQALPEVPSQLHHIALIVISSSNEVTSTIACKVMGTRCPSIATEYNPRATILLLTLIANHAPSPAFSHQVSKTVSVISKTDSPYKL